MSKKLTRAFEGHDEVDFDQFLAVIGKGLQEKKMDFKNVEFESIETNPDGMCFICPVGHE